MGLLVFILDLYSSNLARLPSDLWSVDIRYSLGFPMEIHGYFIVLLVLPLIENAKM